MLKKEFKKHDVKRLRNLIKGKSSSRTSQGVGYTKSSSEDHEEGDVWKENGRTWTIKDGITENITKLDKFKKATVPLFCPNCKKIMDKQLDANYYKSYGTIIDYKNYFKEKLAESTKGYITESGEVEQWLGSIDKDRAQESLDSVIEYLEGLKK